MAASTTPGLTPHEVAFLAEHELVEVIPRQRLEGLQLLGGPTQPLVPPLRAVLPLWLALLLKRQQRADILAPAWLNVTALTKIINFENEVQAFTPSPAIPAPAPGDSTSSPPFTGSSTASASSDALPYHWLETAHLLLEGASEDIADADAVWRLIRDLRECRAAKMRTLVGRLDGGKETRMNGVGAMEMAEHRAFISGVVDGLRKIGASKETSRRDREEEEREGGGQAEDDDDDMEDG